MFQTISLLFFVAAPAPPPIPPGAIKLLAGTDAYNDAAGTVVTFMGSLEKAERWQFRTKDGGDRESVYPVHAADRAAMLTELTGKSLRLSGKLVTIKSETGPRTELWPAWVQPLAGPTPLVLGADGIYARCDWQPEIARKRGTSRYIISSGEDLAKLMRVSGATAEQTASRLLAQRMGVAAIDWDKHFVLCISAGLQTGNVEKLVIGSAKEKDGRLRVVFRLLLGKDGGIGYPAQTVLLPRTKMPVHVEHEPNR